MFPGADHCRLSATHLWEPMMLPCCTSLRSLRIMYSTEHTLTESFDVLPRMMPGPSIISILSQAPPTLQDVTLVLRLPSPFLRDVAERDLDSWDWEALTGILTSFGSLKVVRFLEEERSAPSQFGRFGQQIIRERMNVRIRQELPKLWEAGKLRFS